MYISACSCIYETIFLDEAGGREDRLRPQIVVGRGSFPFGIGSFLGSLGFFLGGISFTPPKK